MKQVMYTFGFLICFSFFGPGLLCAQNAYNSQKQLYANTSQGLNQLEDSMKKEFKERKLNWPPQSVYIRSFKQDRQLELWVRNNPEDSFSFFKSYNVCMQSGQIGPKRSEGDNQVPEGFYYVNEFNSKSNYHLSLGINYPNSSDKVLSDPKNPGGEIYIHGNCVSTGCIAIQDQPIEEVYFIASKAKAGGQDFIPVHIFPVKYDEPKSLDYLTKSIKGNQAVHKYILNIKAVFDYFEKHRQLPVIMVTKKGDYLIN